MIEQSVPALGAAEIYRMRRVAFEATMDGAPEPRKTRYLMNALEFWRVDPLPRVGHGLAVSSVGGKQVALYLPDSLLERAGKELEPGAGAMFYGYHVFGTKYGPGILVSDFTAAPREPAAGWWDRFKRWVQR